jgi:hypothetical protein
MPVGNILSETHRLKEVECAPAAAPIAVAGEGAVAYGPYFALPLEPIAQFGAQFQAESTAGTPAIKVELECSNVAPATEGAADDNFVIPEGHSALIDNINDTDVHIVDIVPATARYARPKFTGLSGCAADAAVVTAFFRMLKGGTV